ncbi:MAG: hypothetical protein CBB87_11610 [Micavibrio sp. TMED27]|nr:hypothetical protein [Micavibrio sp.]OUT89616.1 MAG: hypothetical protein CBB87_11610 [Micavibrio sp. TMED27]
MGSILVSIVAIVISLITFFWGFSKNKKLSAETEWHRTLASDFLEQANNFSKMASQIVVGISLWSSMQEEGKSDDAERQNEEIRSYINKISLYEWELKKYSQFAPCNADRFQESAQELFKLLRNLIAYCKDPKVDQPFNLEEIREAQFSFIKVSRALHKELLGI